MPSITQVVKKFTKQKMVYWEKEAADPNARTTYKDPEEVTVRWDDKRREIITATGRRIITRAQLLLWQPVVEGSLVWLGTLAAWKALPTYPAIPTMNQGAYEIVGVDGTPDLKAQGFVYQAYL